MLPLQARQEQTEAVLISILTRPEGRVLHWAGWLRCFLFQISILTRPEGRVLPEAPLLMAFNTAFQSSPAPKDGCYSEPEYYLGASVLFQSSPAPKDGCYIFFRRDPFEVAKISILTRPEGRVLPLHK